jgi:hypothetical protein
MLYVLITMLAASMALAFGLRTAWAIGLPGLVLLALIFWLIFGG